MIESIKKLINVLKNILFQKRRKIVMLSSKRMLDSFEYKGSWWLPDKPEIKIFGTLTFNPLLGAELNLFGMFDEKPNRKLTEFKIVHGITNNGDQITLYKCTENQLNNSFSGFPTSRLDVLIVFENIYFVDYDNLKIQEVYAKYTHFTDWISMHGYKERTNKLIQYEELKPITFNLNHIFDIKFEIKSYLDSSMSQNHFSTIKQEEYFVCTSKTPTKINEFFRVTNSFMDFLSLITLNASTYTTFQFIITEDDKADNNTLEIITPAIAYFRLDRKSLESRKDISRFDMLFVLPEVIGKNLDILKNWLIENSLFQNIKDPYFRAVYTAEPFLEEEFLNLVRVTESFSAQILKPREIKNVNIDLRIEHTLKNYLNNIVYFQQLIANPTKFGKDIEDTRHRHTHNIYALDRNSLKGIEMYKYTIALKAMAIAIFLKYIGFQDTEIEVFFKRNRTTQYWLDQYSII